MPHVAEELEQCAFGVRDHWAPAARAQWMHVEQSVG
jgi:hypothetical protein